jgi:hypothetical protein
MAMSDQADASDRSECGIHVNAAGAEGRRSSAGRNGRSCSIVHPGERAGSRSTRTCTKCQRDCRGQHLNYEFYLVPENTYAIYLVQV